VNNADEARRAVDSLARDRAGFIKVYSRLTPEEFRAIAEQAKKNGLAFAGHVPTLVSVDEALTLGMQTIEHLQMFTTACSSRETELRGALISAVASSKGWDSAGVVQRGQGEVQVQTFDPAKCRSLAERVARSSTWMVPTIVVLRSTSFLDDSTLRKDSRLEYIPGFFRNSWDPSVDFRFRTVTPTGWAMRKRVFARQLEIVRILHQAGAKFLAGTDLSNPYIYPGFSLHEELGWMVSLGFTPLEALQAATLNPARFLNATDSLGTVKAGKVADLVVLDANPLADIKNLGRIHAVVLNGAVVDSAGRAKILANAKRLAAGGAPR
jgi:imidazolonepropionase-like amidohydrolase